MYALLKTVVQFVVAFLMSFGVTIVFNMFHHPQSWERCLVISFAVVVFISNLFDDLAVSK